MRLPDETDNFAVTELAWLQYETMKTVIDWMEEKSNDEAWLTKFLPKDIKIIHRRIIKMVNSLRIAGYHITGIEILE